MSRPKGASWGSPRRPRAVGRPRRRLFCVFDDPVAGQAAGDWLAVERDRPDDVWVLSGEDGLAFLDVRGTDGGLGVRVVRVLERVMSNDLDYLESFGEAIRAGGTVLSVPAHDLGVAEGMAVSLAPRGGRAFAYFGEFEFEPVRVGTG